MGDLSFSGNNGPISIRNETAQRRSSVLGKLVEIIASGDITNNDLGRSPAEINTKINFNDLKIYRWIRDEYVDNNDLIESSVSHLDTLIMNGSTRLKRHMNSHYKEALAAFGLVHGNVDIVKLKKNSDFIVKKVIELTTDYIRNSSDVGDGYYDEDIVYGATLITSYAIVECTVLENPNDYN